MSAGEIQTNNTSHTVRLARWDTACEGARAVRHAVFVIEQGIPSTLEWDEWDAPSWHVVTYDRVGLACGTARLLPDGRIGRMAVLSTHRRQQIGAAMLQALIDQAVALGYAEVCLHAQQHAASFYERHGFFREGALFLEVEIPHIAMRRHLTG